MTATSALSDRRIDSNALIDKLVHSRNEALVLLGTLASIKPFRDADGIPELVQRFCQTLIDYTAHGHFQLYRWIAEGTERRGSVLEIADAVYPRISDTTETILLFNDKYETEEQIHHLDHLMEDLSVLGEELAVRIELEDQLLDALRQPRAA